MRLVYKFLLIGFCGLALQACGLVDDYILGKDNSFKPKPLPVIHSRLNLNKVWSAKIGQSKQTPTYYKLKPVIVGEKVYTADTSGRVTALSVHRGKILWTNPLEHGIVSGPTVAHDKVIVATDNGSIVALSSFDGHLLWETSLASEVLAKAAITHHAVIVKTMDGHLYALDLGTGKKLWVIEHGAPSLILKASSAPIIVVNTALVGYSDGKLDAVDLEKGRIIWQRGIAYPNGASDVERLVDIDADPLLRNKWVYMASYQGFIGAFDIENGQFIWSKKASVYKNMAMDEDTLYVTDSHDVLWAYQLSTGQVKWKQTALKGNDLTEPVLLGQRIIVGDKGGHLHVLSKSTGAPIGREDVGAPIYISPAVSHRHIFVMTADGMLHAYKVTLQS
jgi:outer membrane protein assembly factor BamB